MQENQSKKLWSPADLFFLSDALKRGMKPNEVAGFLGRAACEVVAKPSQTPPLGEKKTVNIMSLGSDDESPVCRFTNIFSVPCITTLPKENVDGEDKALED
jgi:hypothetical protein